MTKYVLNSGGIRNNPQKGKEFFAELLKGLGKSPKMLVVLFAQPREDWEQKFAQYEVEMIERMPEGVVPKIELAIPDTFEEQIQRNDIVYIHGGDDHLLRHWFDKFDIPKIWDGKVVAGSSAGSDILVQHYWTCDWRKPMDGLGIIPIKFIPHFKSEYGADDPLRGAINWDIALHEITDYGQKDLPIHALEEGHFIVVEQ